MAYNPSTTYRQTEAGADANEDDCHSFPDHHPEHCCGLGTQRHTDADFSAPP
jgi:hypothetical protein